MNVSEIFGVNGPVRLSNQSSDKLVSDCYIGVEVELDRADNLSQIDLWQRVHEGSLHDHGAEYTFAAPMFGQDAVDALRNLNVACLRGAPYCSVDASVHVHVNALDINNEQYIRWVLLYAMLEPLLIKTYCPDREDNPFCIPMYKNPELCRQIGAWLSGVDDGLNHTGMSSRYSALNVLATARFGTLEFRSMHSTYNENEILRWINVLLCIKQKAANGKGDCWRPYLEYKHSPAEIVVLDVFGEWGREMLSTPDAAELLHTGMQTARCISNMHRQSRRSRATNPDLSSWARAAEAAGLYDTILAGTYSFTETTGE